MNFTNYLKLAAIISFSLILTGCKNNATKPTLLGGYLVNDFFPLKVGNKWTFNYNMNDRYDITNMYNSKGTLTWEVIENKSPSDFVVRSALAAVRRYFNSSRDSVVPPDTVDFEVTETFGGTVTFQDPHLLVDPISFNRFIQNFSGAGTIHIVTRANEDVIDLSLQENIGIEQFTMTLSHNSAPDGTVSLTNYSIQKN